MDHFCASYSRTCQEHLLITNFFFTKKNQKNYVIFIYINYLDKKKSLNKCIIFTFKNERCSISLKSQYNVVFSFQGTSQPRTSWLWPLHYNPWIPWLLNILLFRFSYIITGSPGLKADSYFNPTTWCLKQTDCQPCLPQVHPYSFVSYHIWCLT